MSEALDVKCFRCKKRPDEIDEYLPGRAWDEGEFESPSDYVQNEEGTFNPENGHFACTACYIAIGMPALDWPDKWMAP